ncbi:MAG TPA: hypothetical protein VJ888_10155 [Mobilitalea sp.]|nr:hypothetical protein [Mobilitalea sp.]
MKKRHMLQHMSIMMIVTMVQSMYTQEILLPEVGVTEHTIQDRHVVHHYTTGKLIHNHYHLVVQVAASVHVLVPIPTMFIVVIMDIRFLLQKYGTGLVIIVAHLIQDHPIAHHHLVPAHGLDTIH